MKRLHTMASALRGFIISVFFIAGLFGAVSQSKALPVPILTPLGGCCFRVAYALPAAEAGNWVSMTITPGGGVTVVGASSTPNFGILWTPASATWTHTMIGPYFPTGPNIVVGRICFNAVGAFVVTITFVDKFGGVYSVPYPLNCPPIIGGFPGLNASGTSIGDSGNTPKSQIEEMAGIEPVLSTSLYPNPTNDETTVSLSLADSAPVTITVNDMTGKVVSTIENGAIFNAGVHNFPIETNNYSAGAYYVQIHSGSYSNTLQLNVVK